MSLLILHLSDLHLSSGANTAQDHIDHIVGAVQAEALGCSAILLAVTGDLIDRGSTLAFDKVTDFLNSLEEKLRSLKPGIAYASAIVPGNHDLKLTPEDQARTHLVQAIQQNPALLDKADDSLLAPCVNAQADFFRFLEARTGRTFPTARDKLYYEQDVILAGMTVRIRCLNTSWLSTTNEQRGSLLVYIPHSEEVLNDRLTVTLMHHPYAWLETENARRTRRIIEHTSDVILTGHEHAGDAYSKRTIRSNRNEYIEGAALQGNTPDIELGFNILLIDPATSLLRTTLYTWNGAFFDSSDAGDWVSLERSILKQTLPFQNLKSFASTLTDPGANFYHPAKESLILSDFYVYPDCIDRSYGGSHSLDSSEQIRSADIVAKAISNKTTIFIGAEKCGRTALIRQLYVDFQREALLPVLLNLRPGTTVNSASMANLLNDSIKEQYGEEQLQQILQFPRTRRAIFIDDLQASKLNREGVNRLITNSLEFADTLVFTASAFYPLLDFFDEAVDEPSLLHFKHYFIQRFGRLLRSRLVRRWISIGREQELSVTDLSHRCRTTERLLDTLLRKSIVPSYPLYILTLIQAAEANQTLLLKLVPLAITMSF